MAMNANGRRIRKHRLKADINVVPYIDVMLVLLIIFMVTAPLMNPGVDVDLPDSNVKSLKQSKDPMIVQVAAAGAYALVQPGEGRQRPMSEEEIETRSRDILHQKPTHTIFVGVDASTSYQNRMAAHAPPLLNRAEKDDLGRKA